MCDAPLLETCRVLQWDFLGSLHYAHDPKGPCSYIVYIYIYIYTLWADRGFPYMDPLGDAKFFAHACQVELTHNLCIQASLSISCGKGDFRTGAALTWGAAFCRVAIHKVHLSATRHSWWPARCFQAVPQRDLHSVV